MNRQLKTVVDAVEAAYASLSEDAPFLWLERVLAEIQGCVRDCIGGFAYAYDIGGPAASWRISYPIVSGAPPEMAAHIFRAFGVASSTQRQAVLPRLGPAGTFSEVTGQALSVYGERQAARFGVLDAIHVNALDTDEQGVLVALLVPKLRRLAPAERSRLAMLAAHVASARRLLLSARSEEPDAIFERSGKVAHLRRGHESALTVLRESLLRIERARASQADSDEVLRNWQALVAGRYSLVGRFDTDGRRYVVAYENPPNVRDPRGLTPAEAAIASWARRGHSQKLIAYELGLSVGTVGGMLGRIFRKLRVRSRAELLARLSTPASMSRLSVGGKELVLFSSGAASPGHLDGLTEAERDVVRGALAGTSTADIARARRTSSRTVAHQLTSAFRKLGVRSRAELAALGS